MAKSKKLEQKSKFQHRGISLRKFSSRFMKVCGGAHQDKEASKKKEWEDAVCSVCLEFPHNAVLLLCSSYDKGCRPYMCATSHRYSNCLDQYKKAYTEVTSSQNTQSWQTMFDGFNFPEESTDGFDFSEDSRTSKLLCPLCRGQVRGWTLVEQARRYLNAKKRTCMQDNCSFLGNYKQLRKHVKLEHPLARPRDVDPTRAAKWKKLESERDHHDVLSTIRSTMPGAIVIGDYVIERNSRGGYDGDNYSDYDPLDYEYFDRVHHRFGVASRHLGNNVPRSHRGGLISGRRVGRRGR
ncbi:hypothetical protein ACS0TY_027682 [Phlomoides rotata]